jgi:hypothetical protein
LLCFSASQVHRLIDGLVEKGIPSERIIVGGFSQVCATRFSENWLTALPGCANI